MRWKLKENFKTIEWLVTMQNNVISFYTKKEILIESQKSRALAQRRQLKREVIGHFYKIEKTILEAPQNEYSEDARQGIISLINYFKSI